MTEAVLLDFKKKAGIKNGDIEWEFLPASPPCERFCFPVSKRHVVIQKAKECSDLLLKVPSKRSNWVYVSPKYDLDLIHFLENWSP